MQPAASAPPKLHGSDSGEAAAVVAHAEHGHGPKLSTLVIGALGVVFGDIGTSPLYAIKECVEGEHGVSPTHENILGVLSLIVWSLIAVVAGKYLTFIMRADNKGEGGIFSLLALIPPNKRQATTHISWTASLVIFGAALLYGDGMITPAISVLSAMEGLAVATTALKHWIVPLTCVILLGVFWVQKKGTAGIGRIFGPIMIVWFLALAVLGVIQIVAHPAVLQALSPTYAVQFFVAHKWRSFLVLSAVVLVITGGEALYADMGHFGRRPIRLAWYIVVMPALLLNYFGQGALILEHESTATNPFYAMVPTSLIYPMVVLSTMAAIIASQAMISGAFSVTRQAIQLGFFPRVTIVHTSGEAEGQIYIPEINAALMVACIWLVITFKESTALASAYGIAVTGTMTITSIIYYVVVTEAWHWPRWKAIPLVGAFLLFDLSFFGANLLKFFSGGWFPIGMAVIIFLVMTTWKKGRAMLARTVADRLLPIDMFLTDLASLKPPRVPGIAVFMSSNPNGVPIVLLHHWKHNQMLHQTVVLLSVISENMPEVPVADRLQFKDLGQGFYHLGAHYGFMQTPNVPDVLQRAAALYGIPYEPGRTSYYLGRETLLATKKSGMHTWRKMLFAFISRNSRSATQYFCIPPDRVVELGMQIDL
ncbi:MAG TPA: KUP/HAK/KT family potassium transporter [Polyangiaceae bacterium]|nr:KUP/HAK/KT family potassium transporter [Polyangiaceae bacterium]